jgi:adenosine deaminase
MTRHRRWMRRTRTVTAARATGRASAAVAAVTMAAVSLVAPFAAAGSPLGDPGRVRHPVRPAPPGDAVRRVDTYLSQVRDEPGRLREFLADLPKGADLHTHLSGAVPTERLLDLAVDDGLCVGTTDHAASTGPCGAGQRPAADTRTDDRFHDAVVRAWSMKGFTGRRAESGHDHFFATFGKFGEATARKGDMLATVAARTAAQNVQYLETLLSRQSGATADLAQRVGYTSDFARLRARLLADDAFDQIVGDATRETDADFARMRSLLRCATPSADRGCDLVIRQNFQVGRLGAPEVVFAQLLLGFELAERDRRYVGVNLVQPEDDVRALRDYRTHMRMVRYLRGVYDRARVTLHAGELTPGLGAVRPRDLTFHIRSAVETAGAARIGHGVGIGHERGSRQLLKAMARRHVLVEVPLTSNCQILRVCGREHPLPRYRRYGVPVTLATDDEGVSRTDLTHEYARAVREFRLRYGDLKAMARAALDHGFLSGRRLWLGPDDHRPAAPCAGERLGGTAPSPACAALLRASDKAALQWRQEAAFRRFEARYGAEAGAGDSAERGTRRG